LATRAGRREITPQYDESYSLGKPNGLDIIGLIGILYTAIHVWPCFATLFRANWELDAKYDSGCCMVTFLFVGRLSCAIQHISGASDPKDLF